MNNHVTRPLQVGIQLPEVERVVAWPEYREMAVTAEAAGFDSLWVGDHLLYRDDDGTRGPWEAWSLLAALAAITNTVQLGPLVAATSFHNPVMLAKKASTVDEISDGRLILGLGAGWNRSEYDAYGFPYDHRVVALKRPSRSSGPFSPTVPSTLRAPTTRRGIVSLSRRHVRQAFR